MFNKKVSYIMGLLSLLLVSMGVFAIAAPDSAYADARTSDVPAEIWGDCYIGGTWMSGGQSYFDVGSWCNGLDGFWTHTTFTCQNHTAAAPEDCWSESAHATFNNCSYDGGWVEYWVFVIPDTWDLWCGYYGYVSNEYGLIGFQAVGGYIRKSWTFNHSLDVNWRLDTPKSSGGYNTADENSATNYGRCSVKINGSVKATDCSDFCNSYKQGSSYEVYNMKSVRTGYRYRRVCEGSATGKLDKDRAVRLEYWPITYTVKYNGNGNTGGSTGNTACEYDRATNLASNGFSKKGYRFNGWAKGSASGTKYSAGASIKNLSSTQGSTVNMYATWIPNEYTVQYNANGGSGSTPATKCVYDKHGTRIASNGFTRTGWTFRGWSTQSGFTWNNAHKSLTDKEAGKQPGDEIFNWTDQHGAVITLYAVWDPVVTFVVDNDSNFTQNGFKATELLPYNTAVPESIWTDKTNKAARANSRGVSGLSTWSTTNTYQQNINDAGQGATGAAFNHGTAITGPTTFYIHNSVWYHYSTTDRSSLKNPNYQFYIRSTMRDEDKLDTTYWSNLYPYYANGSTPSATDNSHKNWAWYGATVKMVSGLNVYEMDPDPHVIPQGNVYVNAAASSPASGYSPGVKCNPIYANTVFYVDWPWTVYDGVQSQW